MSRNHVLTVAAILLLTGCARHYTPEATQDSYGFWSGLWHGIVMPWAVVTNLISWVLQLIDIRWLESIQIIGRPNTGLGYYVGFGLGALSYSAGTAR